MTRDDTDPKALRAVAMRAEGGYANLLWTTVLALLDRLDAAEAKADRLDDTNESLWSAQMRAETAERELAAARNGKAGIDEILQMLHGQVAEMCAFAGASPDAAQDSWTLRDRIVALVRERDEARAALDEREGDMHLRIRAGYDTTVAECWRAKVAEVERERDEARVRELEHHDGQTRAALAHHTAMLVPLLAVAEVAKALSERFAMLAEDGEVEECPFCFAEVQDEECASDCELTRLHFALQDVDAVGLTVARGALLGMSDDNADAVDGAWRALDALKEGKSDER